MPIEVDSRRQAESILRMKIFHTTKCRAYPHEKPNTSKGVIRSKELAIDNRRGDVSIPGKIGGHKHKEELASEKKEKKSKPNIYSLIFNQPHIPKEVKIGLSSTSKLPWGPSNAKIWTPQGSLLRTTHMCQMQWKRSGPHGGRLLEGNEMCKLPTRSPDLERKKYLK